MDVTIEGYAAIMAELADAGERRAEVLAKHGLDEAGWERVDAHWQEQLSAALEADDDGLALLSAHAAAYEAAQRALALPISLEQFARVTRRFEASGDLRASLAKEDVTLAAYVRGAEHWSRQLATDAEAERRFDDVLHGKA